MRGARGAALPPLLLGMALGVAFVAAPEALAARPVAPPQRQMSLGFMAGEPSGGTFKMINPIYPAHAWEAGIGWSMAGDNGLDVHAQHQWHWATASRSERGATTFYLGAGGRVKQVDGTRIGVRGAVGFNYLAGMRPRSWEAYIELAPIVDLTPDNDTWLDAIIGVRWFIPGGTGR